MRFLILQAAVIFAQGSITDFAVNMTSACRTNKQTNFYKELLNTIELMFSYAIIHILKK